MLIISPLFLTSVTPSDWQLHRCRGNQWHPKAGVAHLVQCVRPPRPLHQPARRELQLLLRAGIHWHLLPREWVIIRHTTHRLYLSSLTLSGNHMILTVIQTPVSLIVTLLVQITVQGKKKKQDKKEIRWKTSAVKCLLSRPISLWVLVFVLSQDASRNQTSSLIFFHFRNLIGAESVSRNKKLSKRLKWKPFFVVNVWNSLNFVKGMTNN